MFGFPLSFLLVSNGSVFRERCTESKCGISGGFYALAVIESRLFMCPTFYDMYMFTGLNEIHFPAPPLAEPSVNTEDIDGKQTTENMS